MFTPLLHRVEAEQLVASSLFAQLDPLCEADHTRLEELVLALEKCLNSVGGVAQIRLQQIPLIINSAAAGGRRVAGKGSVAVWLVHVLQAYGEWAAAAAAGIRWQQQPACSGLSKQRIADRCAG